MKIEVADGNIHDEVRSIIGKWVSRPRDEPQKCPVGFEVKRRILVVGVHD